MRLILLFSVLTFFNMSSAHSSDVMTLQNGVLTTAFDTSDKYSKNMVRVFKALEDKKLNKAKKLLADIDEKYNKDKKIDKSVNKNAKMYLHPLYHIAEGIIMGQRTDEDSNINPSYDPWMAYAYIKIVSPAFHSSVNALFIENKIHYTFDGIRSSLKDELISSIPQNASENVYDRLFATIEEKPREMLLRQESTTFNSTKLTISVGECSRYLKKYQKINITHYTIISERRDSLAFVQMGKSVKACQEYIKEYPNSAYVNKAKELESLYAFNDAKSENSIQSYEAFIKSYGHSSYANEAHSRLNQVKLSKYYSENTSLQELCHYIKNEQDQTFADNYKICKLYINIINLPTSSMMMNIDNIIGRLSVETNNQINMSSYEEILEINDQGLVVSQSNSKSEKTITFRYRFDQTHGWQLLSKLDSKGNEVNYTTTYNEQGLISSISAEDGTKEVYTYDGNYLKEISLYHGNSPVKIDAYNEAHQLISSKRSGGITIIYEYNYLGDVIKMSKMNGKNVVESTTYEYEYFDNSDAWRVQKQYNNDELILVKVRHLISGTTTSATQVIKLIH